MSAIPYPKLYALVVAALLIAMLFSGCGLDEYQYIEPVEEASVVSSGSSAVSFRLPDTGGVVSLNFQQSSAPSVSGLPSNFFDNYKIYYKIYLSSLMYTTPTEDQYSSINSTMASDYNAIEPYTNTTNNNASSGNTTFTSRSFYEVDEDSVGGTLFRDKSSLPNALPMTNQWYFFYSTDLANTANIENNNMDVVSGDGSNYAWTMMYVIRKSFSPLTLTDTYSSPTFLGVFILPTTVATTEISLSGASAAIGATNDTATITLSFGSSLNGLDPSNIAIQDTSTASSLVDRAQATFKNAGAISAPTATGNDWTFTITADPKQSGSTPPTPDLTGHTLRISPTRSGYTFNPTFVTCDVQ